MQRRQFVAAAACLLPATTHAAPSPIVLELFTSQGCSSCPPADALLGELSRQRGVIALAWHVDYWNNLGWRDPYASRLATVRQQTYAQQLQDEVYTPALVINGTRMVVGSDRGAVNAAMAAGASPSVSISVNDGRRAQIAAAPGPVTMWWARYDPEHATAVGGGENRGVTLREYRVVREARVLEAWDGGARSLLLPAANSGQGAVLLLQSAELKVLGAVDLPAG